MKKTILTFAIALSTILSFAQVKPTAAPYNFAAGIRAGFLNAVTVKYFLLENIAIEVIAGTRYFQGPHVSLLLEYHHSDAFNQDNLYFFYGGGINFGHQNRIVYDPYSRTTSTSSHGYLGAEGIVGLEYNFTSLINFPLAASIDIRPSLDLIPFPRINLGSGAISVRYIFN